MKKVLAEQLESWNVVLKAACNCKLHLTKRLAKPVNSKSVHVFVCMSMSLCVRDYLRVRICVILWVWRYWSINPVFQQEMSSMLGEN